MQNRREDKWTIDKRIPVIPAALLIAQLFVFGWCASKLDSRVTALEEKAAATSPLMEKVIRMEVTMNGMGKQLDTISEKLDKRLESGKR